MRTQMVFATISIEGVGAPLLDADWNMIDAMRVGAVAGDRWFVWNLSGSIMAPQETQIAHPQIASHFRYLVSAFMC